MSQQTTELAAVPVEMTSVPSDWRMAHMASRVDEGRLGEEWDRRRLLLLPRPDGLLTRRAECAAPGCPNQVPGGAVPLCVSHAGRFARSARAGVEEWLARGEIHPARRRLHEGACAVTGAGAEHCARPAHGVQRLCRSHLAMWLARRRHGVSLEDFLDRARPLESFGECAAASCYLQAVYRRTRLCEVHYRAWNEHGLPDGKEFQAFLARARQPANQRVLSLRGLPVLVRTELLHGICCRMDDQIRTGTEDMRGFVDLLRETGVASLTDIDTIRFSRIRSARVVSLATSGIVCVWPTSTLRSNGKARSGICGHLDAPATWTSPPSARSGFKTRPKDGRQQPWCAGQYRRSSIMSTRWACCPP